MAPRNATQPKVGAWSSELDQNSHLWLPLWHLSVAFSFAGLVRGRHTMIVASSMMLISKI